METREMSLRRRIAASYETRTKVGHNNLSKDGQVRRLSSYSEISLGVEVDCCLLRSCCLRLGLYQT